MIRFKDTLFSFICVLFYLMVSALAQSEELTLNGSSTVYPAVVAAAKEFKINPPVTFNISAGGSSHGVSSVAMNTVLIGAASRKLREEEIKKWPVLKTTTIGYDGIAIILNKATQVTALTREQLKNIYLGKFTNWQEVGGRDCPIYRISRGADRGETDLFLEYTELEEKKTNGSLSYRQKGEQEYTSVKGLIIGPNSNTINIVYARNDAIAYVSLGIASTLFSKSRKITIATLDGIQATSENIKNGDYLLKRPLNLVTNGEPNGLSKNFIDYMLSPVGQRYVRINNFIPIIKMK